MKEKRKFNFTDGVLIFLGIFFVSFVIAMITIFCIKGFVPDGLINMVGMVIAAEGGILWRLTAGKRQQESNLEQLQNNYLNNNQGGVG